MESLLKCENDLEYTLKKFYDYKEKEILVLKIQSKSVKEILYLKTFINAYEDYYKNNSNNSNSIDECDKKKYVFMVHMIRQLYIDKKDMKTINTISYTTEDVQHLFIDNINGKESLDDLYKNVNNNEGVNNFLKNKNLNEKLIRICLDFFESKIKKNLSETKGINSKNFVGLMENYLNDNINIIEKLNETIIKGIKIENVLKKMYEENYIKTNTIDIVSALIDYILDIYRNKALELLEIIENNLFLTTLMVINTEKRMDNDLYDYDDEEKEDIDENEEDKEKAKIFVDDEIKGNKYIENIKNNYLDLLENKNLFEKQYKVNICLLYKIPGLFNLYQEINDYINDNIKNEFYENERKFRLFKPKSDSEEEIKKLINKFHDNENNYLNKLYNHLIMNELFQLLLNEQNNKENDDDEYKYFINLLLNDYITFYLLRNNQKNYNCNDIEHKLIIKLINLRFKNDISDEKGTNIIKQNKNDEIKILLIKILWIESNYEYILNILEIYDILSLLLYSLENKYKKDKLFKDLIKYIQEGNVRYISSKKRNPEHTREINECFYILLASICQCITNENIINQFDSFSIYSYIEKCENALSIITKMSDELHLFLNERFIIEEFLLIINVSNKNEIKDIDFSINILNKLKNLSNIIQLINKKKADINEPDEEYNIINDENNKSNDEDNEDDDKILQLNKAFLDFNKYIKDELNQNNNENNNNEIDKNNDDYYDLLALIYLKEIRKITDINYRKTVLEQILQDEKIIKKSLESFKLLFKNILQPELDKFVNITNVLDKKKDEIINMIENNNNNTLDMTLLYLFEKNTFIYLDKAMSFSLDNKIKEQKFPSYKKNKDPKYAILDEPYKIFKDCIEYLENVISKENKKTINKRIKKIFCIAYIRVYLYKYIYILKDSKQIDDHKIIKTINGENYSKLRNIINIYLYKIIYYINKGDISSPSTQNNFHLDKYNNYKEFIEKSKQNVPLDKFLVTSQIKDFKIFENVFKSIKSYEKNKFKNVDINSIKKEINKREDLFYIISSNILSTYLLQTINYSNSEAHTNYWKNILDNIFPKEEKSLLKFIFNPEDFKKIIDKYNIGKNQIEIEILLYSMRFCFQTIISSTNECIYKKILKGNKQCLNNSYFVGNDISGNNYFDIYIKLNEHFEKRSKKEGAYVCLCKNGYYQYIPPNGYPTKEKNSYEKCKNCSKDIGFYNGFLWKKYIVKREGYYRIFKNDDDIQNENEDQLNQINYMTFEQFINNYIEPAYLKEKKGIYKITDAHFKKPNKRIRHFKRQISYRLLNFILYSHLYYGGLINPQFRYDLPTDMNIIEVLEEDWNKLDIELRNINIDIRIFMNFIFQNLTEKLNSIGEINNIKDLFQIEENLEMIINNLIEKYNEYEIEYNKLNKNLRNIDLNSSINLLKETYDCSLYNEDIYPFYKYFLYTEYVVEDNLKIENKEEYILLDLYLKRNNYIKSIKHLETLDIYNKVNNLLFDTYSNKITRKQAEENKLNEQPVYTQNKEIFDHFFNIINNIDENLSLKEEDFLINFLIEKNTAGSDKLIFVYNKYKDEQNNLIKDIIDIKHNEKGFPISKPINIQIIQKEEIFSFKLKNTSLIEIIFENSFRDKNFRNIIVNYDNIENKLTDLLLRKVKIVDNNLKYIIYINEEYLHENTSKYNEFIHIFKDLKSLNKSEKRQIKKFFDSKITHSKQFLNIINDFDSVILNLKNRFIKKENEYSKNQNIKNENDQKESNFEKEEEKSNEEQKDKLNEEQNEQNNIIEEADKEQNENVNNEENEIKMLEETKIKEIIEKYIGNDKISNEFNDLINVNLNFTLDKIIDIFYFSEKIMFLIAKEELKNYSNKLTNEEKKDLDEFYKINRFLSKEVLLNAIRRYLVRFLIREEDKEKNIKYNNRNFIKFFYIEDLWDNNINKNEKEKKKEIEIIKNLNISINKLLDLHDYLGGDNLILDEMHELTVNEENIMLIQNINEKKIESEGNNRPKDPYESDEENKNENNVNDNSYNDDYNDNPYENNDYDMEDDYED